MGKKQNQLLMYNNKKTSDMTMLSELILHSLIMKVSCHQKSPQLAEDARHLLALLLCPLVSTQLSLCYFQCTLVLPNFEKLSDSLLIWCKSSNFPYHVPYKMDPLAGFLNATQRLSQ